MTGQIPDTLIYNDIEYDIIGVKGEGFFVPEDHGFNLEGMMSCCWRGHVCKYVVEDRKLYLDTLLILFAKYDSLPEIKGFSSRGEEETFPPPFSNMMLSIPFSGILRLGKDFIHEHYIHMGFQKPSAFETVLDLTFDEGLLIEEINRSEEYSRKRGAFKEQYEKDDLMKRIDDAFSLDLDVD